MLESCHVCVAPSYSLCCSVMQCVAVCCSVLQCVADRCVYVCVHNIWKHLCIDSQDQLARVRVHPLTVLVSFRVCVCLFCRSLFTLVGVLHECERVYSMSASTSVSVMIQCACVCVCVY